MAGVEEGRQVHYDSADSPSSPPLTSVDAALSPDIKTSLAKGTWAPGTARWSQGRAVRGLACYQPNFGMSYLAPRLARPLWPGPKGGPWSCPWRPEAEAEAEVTTRITVTRRNLAEGEGGGPGQRPCRWSRMVKPRGPRKPFQLQPCARGAPSFEAWRLDGAGGLCLATGVLAQPGGRAVFIAHLTSR